MFVPKQRVWFLENRVEQLEHILCPCGSHDWVMLEQKTETNSHGDSFIDVTWQCKRCLKKKVEVG